MLVLYGGLFLLLFSRFFYIQATGEVKGYSLEALAAEKYSRTETLKAERGKIYDRNEIVIAEDTNSYRLIAVVSEKATQKGGNPRHVIDPEETAEVLAQYINLSEEEIYDILTPDQELERYQVEFGSAGSTLSHELKLAIEEHELPGILFATEKKRSYPNGKFASHLIGFATKEEESPGQFVTKGKMGLELTYDELLTGKNGKMDYKQDFFGYLLPNSEKMIQEAEDGHNIYLTIDKTIQNFLDDAMNRVESEYNPETILGVVADPKTGEILAMSQRPTFDPENRIGLENNSWLNEVVEGVLEPGSTVKTFTIAAAIDSGNWHPNAIYPSGSYSLLGDKIYDHNNKGWGPISYRDGFLRSSNTMIAKQLEIMGTDVMLDYFDRFGFGKKTGINLPNEASGKILSNNPIELVTTGYGQGSTFTPIQLVQAMTAIANDGEMMQPYVIDKIVNPNTGEVVEDYKPTVKGTPIKEDTAEQMRDLLSLAVSSDIGSGKNFRIDGYEVAGKTGTAQISEGNGDYRKGSHNYYYSFLGMVPADDPQLIVYVAVKYPKLESTRQGSEPVSKVFNSVVVNSLKYLNVNPENVEEVESVTIEDYVGKSANEVQSSLLAKGMNTIIIGDGSKIIDQYPKPNLKMSKNNLIFLKTEGDITLPSFKDWSLRNVLVYKTLSGLNIEIVGEGFVQSQSVSENTVITDDGPIVLKLATPEQSHTSPQTDLNEGSEINEEEGT